MLKTELKICKKWEKEKKKENIYIKIYVKICIYNNKKIFAALFNQFFLKCQKMFTLAGKFKKSA